MQVDDSLLESSCDGEPCGEPERHVKEEKVLSEELPMLSLSLGVPEHVDSVRQDDMVAGADLLRKDLQRNEWRSGLGHTLEVLWQR